ncbi:MAG: PAS domain S-box protein [Chlorobiales bacterium]|nr:PAS domain S-box protein [Chlorobiales bacterium]
MTETVNTTQLLLTIDELQKKVAFLEEALQSGERIAATRQYNEESEKRYRILFEGTLNPILIVNQDGKYIDANEAALQFLETDRDELLGKSVWDYSPENMAENQKLEHAPFLEPRTIETDYQVKGKRKTLLLNIVPMQRGKETILFGIGQDITEGKQAEEERRQWADAFESCVYGIAMANPSTNRVLACNPAFASMFRCSVGQIVGSPILDLYAPSDHEYVKRYLNEANSIGYAQYKVSMIRKDGTTFPVQVDLVGVRNTDGKLLYRVATVQDITEGKKADAERERLMAAIEQAAEVIVITDPAGDIQYANPAFERATGYSRDEALGQNPRILKSGKQDKAFYAAMWQALMEGKTWEGRFINKRKDGTLYTEEVAISPVYDASGTTINYVAVKRDITHELETEQQLLQAQKMESVGRLAGGVAHDFNNLLTAIINYTEMCRRRLPSDHPVHNWLNEVTSASERSVNIIRQLLAFARKQTISPLVLDLNETVTIMLKLLQQLIGEDIELAWIPGHDLWAVKLDPSQIDQILANLCINARDAITNTGRIIIETENTTLDDAYCIDHVGAVPGEYVLLVVSDDGSGMEKDVLDHIFEPFFTTKGIGKGTGLGLATVYGIVKQNNGYIDVYSEPGRGTMFRIYLPRFLGKAPETPLTSPVTVPKGHGETVLLVEDEQSLRATCILLLDMLEYKVLEAETPEVALEVVARHPGEIHLLLTDVIMPGMNGKELAERLWTLKPDLKVMFMSGYPADVINRHGILEQSRPFLEKPFSLSELACKLREVLDQLAPA